MHTKNKYLLFSLTVIILAILILFYPSESYVELNGKKINVEIPETRREMQTGLMFRETLCENCGMLFIFEEEDFHSFWMKNTLIPLDMVFISSDLKVVDVITALPCEEEPCEHYTPNVKALYVLETNVGLFETSIIGQRVKININYSKKLK